MIERKFVAQRMKEYQIQEFITSTLKNVGHSGTKMQKTPLGEKIVIYASRPGLIVGKKGQSIKLLTKMLKKKFNLENPQIEINEVDRESLDANIVAEKIASSLERFGSSKFKAIGHKTIQDVTNSGALGIEIIISGKIPSSRAKSWRFYSGYLKKCGDFSIENVKEAHASAKLKSGIVGIKVSIMPPDIRLPDTIQLLETKETIIEETTEKDNKEKEIPEVTEPKTEITEKKKSKVKMKIKEIRAASAQELNAKLIELKKEFMKINVQISSGTTPKSPGQAKNIKKTIARILTILDQKTKEETKKA